MQQSCHLAFQKYAFWLPFLLSHSAFISIHIRLCFNLYSSDIFSLFCKVCLSTPPGLLPHINVRPYSLEGLIPAAFHRKSICTARPCSAGECVTTFFHSLVPHLVFLQGQESIWRIVQGLHFCSSKERLPQELGEGWDATHGLCVDGAPSQPEGCSCQLLVKALSVPNEQI